MTMEVLQSDQAVPSSLINSKPGNICRITEFQKVHETSSALQVPLLLQDRQLHKLSTMVERRQIAGAPYGKVLRMVTYGPSSCDFSNSPIFKGQGLKRFGFGAWQAIAEMVAVFFIMFSVCGTAIANKKTNGDLNLLGFAIAGGLSVMMMVFAVGHISGAHLNPAVTLAFASKKIFPLQLVSTLLS
jgi:hypothetical protein